MTSRLSIAARTAAISASALPPRGPDEVALPHRCERSQPVMRSAAYAPNRTFPGLVRTSAPGGVGLQLVLSIAFSFECEMAPIQCGFARRADFIIWGCAVLGAFNLRISERVLKQGSPPLHLHRGVRRIKVIAGLHQEAAIASQASN